MSMECNNLFRRTTQDIVREYFLTAVRYPEHSSGLTTFDLNYHSVDNHKVITLDSPGNSYPLMGFWVPQEGSCVIPANPGAETFVSTPDFSGCSLLVDQIDNNQYHVYHVQGGSNYFQSEYLNAHYAHGLGLAAAMVFDDYGDNDKTGSGYSPMLIFFSGINSLLSAQV